MTTCVGFLDKGKVSILLSVERMRNLRINIEHSPVGEFMTCPLFGKNRIALAVSTSNHPVLDIMVLATASRQPMYSFHSEDVTCPACQGNIMLTLSEKVDPEPRPPIPKKRLKLKTKIKKADRQTKRSYIIFIFFFFVFLRLLFLWLRRIIRRQW